MRARGPLWKISVGTTTEAEEAVMELMQEIFEQPASSYSDVETGEVTVAVYLSKAEATHRQRLGEGLKRIKGFGLDVGPGKVLLRKIRREDWAEAWKRHFRPIDVGLLFVSGEGKRTTDQNWWLSNNRCPVVLVLDICYCSDA